MTDPLQLSPERRQLAALRAAVVALLAAAGGLLIDLAHKRVTRPLTPEERARYVLD